MSDVSDPSTYHGADPKIRAHLQRVCVQNFLSVFETPADHHDQSVVADMVAESPPTVWRDWCESQQVAFFHGVYDEVRLSGQSLPYVYEAALVRRGAIRFKGGDVAALLWRGRCIEVVVLEALPDYTGCGRLLVTPAEGRFDGSFDVNGECIYGSEYSLAPFEALRIGEAAQYRTEKLDEIQSLLSRALPWVHNRHLQWLYDTTRSDLDCVGEVPP